MNLGPERYVESVRLARTIFEHGSRINLAEAKADYSPYRPELVDNTFFNLDVGARDYNTYDDKLPDWFKDKLALLMLSPPNKSIIGVGFKENYKYAGGDAMFSIANDVCYVVLNDTFDSLVAEIKALG